MVSLTAGANKLVAISGVDDAPGDANEPSARRNVVVPPGNPGIARIEACPGVVHASSPSRPSKPATPELPAAPGDANEPSARRNVVVPPGNPGIARIEACPGVVHASSPSSPSKPATPELP